MTARLTRRLTLLLRYTIRASGKGLGDGSMERGRPLGDVIAAARCTPGNGGARGDKIYRGTMLWFRRQGRPHPPREPPATGLRGSQFYLVMVASVIGKGAPESAIHNLLCHCPSSLDGSRRRVTGLIGRTRWCRSAQTSISNLKSIRIIVIFYGAAQAAFTQFPVQTLAILTATRTTFCSATCC